MLEGVFVFLFSISLGAGLLGWAGPSCQALASQGHENKKKWGHPIIAMRPFHGNAKTFWSTKFYLKCYRQCPSLIPLPLFMPCKFFQK